MDKHGMNQTDWSINGTTHGRDCFSLPRRPSWWWPLDLLCRIAFIPKTVAKRTGLVFCSVLSADAGTFGRQLRLGLV